MKIGTWIMKNDIYKDIFNNIIIITNFYIVT